MTRRTIYRVAGQSLLVEAQDAWAADAIDALFAGWYLAPDEVAEDGASAPAIVMRSVGRPPRIPAGLTEFAIAGGGTCHTDGRASYIDIGGSIVAIGHPGSAAVDISTNGSLALEAPALTRVVTYGLAAALRQRRLFELHSAAVVDPESESGLLIVGPSGSGKSTLTVHLAAAGWPFLTDDVLLLSKQPHAVEAWPLRRSFAITPQTFEASNFLRSRASLDEMDAQQDAKKQFAPHAVFAGEFRDRCAPRTLFFSELGGVVESRVTPLSPADAMARLIRMSPWSCYDRSTATDHLGVLSALATQCHAYSLVAGKDLLDPQTSVHVIAHYTRST